MSCGLYTERSIPFNKDIWNSWNAASDEQRYNMAVWFFRENWFNGKNKEIILNELFRNKKTNHIESYYNKNKDENILLFDLRYPEEFVERWNIDFEFKPAAYLKIYFNENNQVIKAELYKGNQQREVKRYKIIKHWEKK
jgi:hypothetical protein